MFGKRLTVMRKSERKNHKETYLLESGWEKLARNQWKKLGVREDRINPLGLQEAYDYQRATEGLPVHIKEQRFTRSLS